MITIQKIMTVPAGRRLRLDEPLPAAVNTGRMEVTLLIRPLPAEPPVTAGAAREQPPRPLCGLFAGRGITVAGFLAEKREDEALEFAREGR